MPFFGSKKESKKEAIVNIRDRYEFRDVLGTGCGRMVRIPPGYGPGYPCYALGYSRHKVLHGYWGLRHHHYKPTKKYELKFKYLQGFVLNSTPHIFCQVEKGTGSIPGNSCSNSCIAECA
uniref:Uncharacterized protein n=1 Tax=Romanomermis culicivorax TaxID=13658 RepID=A0A915JQQ1_ROMCU